MEKNTHQTDQIQMVHEKPRAKTWFSKKIEALEGEIAQLNAQVEEAGDAKEAYAMGYFDCMTKYQLLTKTQRRVIRDKMISVGSVYHRNFKAASRRFK